MDGACLWCFWRWPDWGLKCIHGNSYSGSCSQISSPLQQLDWGLQRLFLDEESGVSSHFILQPLPSLSPKLDHLKFSLFPRHQPIQTPGFPQSWKSASKPPVPGAWKSPWLSLARPALAKVMPLSKNSCLVQRFYRLCSDLQVETAPALSTP